MDADRIEKIHTGSFHVSCHLPIPDEAPHLRVTLCHPHPKSAEKVVVDLLQS